MLTRRFSRGVVASCFGSSKPGSSLAITGSPGTGKSWTLVYALQQALLYENACVLVFLQKENVDHLYIRKGKQIFAWERYGQSRAVSALFRSSNVLVLLDPKEATEEGAKYAAGERMLIFAASNNTKHFANEIYKVQDDPERYLSPFTENELKVSLPLMLAVDDQTWNLEQALEWAKIVGRLPRYLLAEKRFNARKDQLYRSVDALKKDADEMKEVLEFLGKDDLQKLAEKG